MTGNKIRIDGNVYDIEDDGFDMEVYAMFDEKLTEEIFDKEIDNTSDGFQFGNLHYCASQILKEVDPYAYSEVCDEIRENLIDIFYGSITDGIADYNLDWEFVDDDEDDEDDDETKEVN